MDLEKQNIYLPLLENNKLTQNSHSIPRKVRDSSPIQEKPAAISQVNSSVIKEKFINFCMLGQWNVYSWPLERTKTGRISQGKRKSGRGIRTLEIHEI